MHSKIYLLSSRAQLAAPNCHHRGQSTVLRQRQASRGRRGADPARAQKVKYAVRRHWYARRLGTCRLSFRPHVYSTSPCAVRPRLPDAVDERAGTRECRSWLLLTRDIYRSHSRTPACHSDQSSCSYPSLRMTLASSARAAAQKRNRRPAAVTALIANGHRGRYNNLEPRQTTGARPGRSGSSRRGAETEAEAGPAAARRQQVRA